MEIAVANGEYQTIQNFHLNSQKTLIKKIINIYGHVEKTAILDLYVQNRNINN
jgi:hypothetical protein